MQANCESEATRLLKTRGGLPFGPQFYRSLRYHHFISTGELAVYNSVSIILRPHLCLHNLAWENWLAQSELHVPETRRVSSRKLVNNMLDTNPNCTSACQDWPGEAPSFCHCGIDMQWIEISGGSSVKSSLLRGCLLFDNCIWLSVWWRMGCSFGTSLNRFRCCSSPWNFHHEGRPFIVADILARGIRGPNSDTYCDAASSINNVDNLRGGVQYCLVRKWRVQFQVVLAMDVVVRLKIGQELGH